MTLEVRVARDGDDLRAGLEVRRQVFTSEQGVPSDVERDGRDVLSAAGVHHLLAVDDEGGVVGAARVVETGDGTARLGRVAVLPASRRRGVGSALVAAAADVARERGQVALVADAQETALDFWLAAGYEETGERVSSAGLAHRVVRAATVPGLREADDGDGERVQELVGTVVAEGTGRMLDLGDAHAWTLRPGSTEDRQVWVVQGPGAYLRAVGAWRSGADRGAEVTGVHVRASARGQGLGRALLRVAQRAARDAGCAELTLAQEADTEALRRLCAAAGWEDGEQGGSPRLRLDGADGADGADGEHGAATASG